MVHAGAANGKKLTALFQMPQFTYKAKSSRGVTLLEMIMVMVLLFIVIGVVAPRFTDFVPELRLRKSAAQFYAGLHRARNEASTYGIRARFAVHQTSRTFRIVIEPRPMKKPDEFTSLNQTWDTTELPEGVEIPTLEGFTQDSATGEQYVEFRADGTSAADATIVLQNEGGDQRTLKVTASTGQVKFVEEKKE